MQNTVWRKLHCVIFWVVNIVYKIYLLITFEIYNTDLADLPLFSSQQESGETA